MPIFIVNKSKRCYAPIARDETTFRLALTNTGFYNMFSKDV